MKRPATKVEVAIYNKRFDLSDNSSQITYESAWVPPSAGEIVDHQELLAQHELPKPDVSSFHVAGFDIEIEPHRGYARYPSEHPRVVVRVRMKVLIQGEDRWGEITSESVVYVSPDKVTRERAWKAEIHNLIVKLLSHELDESLRFDGSYYRDPHPESRFVKPPEMLPLGKIPKDLLDAVLKSSGSA